MLYVVLALVLIAFALLVTSLATSFTVFAWISLGVSVLAAAVLFADWVSGRQPTRADDAEPDTDATPTTAGDPEGAPRSTVAESTLVVAESGDSSDGVTPDAAKDQLDPDREPDEEVTDAADLLVVSESEVEVRVLDERPRYHLGRCRWLDDRPTLPLSLSEARRLGFSPCAVCTPNAAIAARHRPSPSQTELSRTELSPPQDTRPGDTQPDEIRNSET